MVSDRDWTGWKLVHQYSQAWGQCYCGYQQSTNMSESQYILVWEHIILLCTIQAYSFACFQIKVQLYAQMPVQTLLSIHCVLCKIALNQGLSLLTWNSCYVWWRERAWNILLNIDHVVLNQQLGLRTKLMCTHPCMSWSCRWVYMCGQHQPLQCPPYVKGEGVSWGWSLGGT